MVHVRQFTRDLQRAVAELRAVVRDADRRPRVGVMAVTGGGDGDCAGSAIKRAQRIVSEQQPWEILAMASADNDQLGVLADASSCRARSGDGHRPRSCGP